MKILGLSGSLRPTSTNTAVLRAIGELLPDSVELTIHDYSAVPLFHGDREAPAAVVELKDAITAADGVLIATPEYNHSVPGVLKNALDWASRPAFRSPFAGKPTGLVSAAPGAVGGARAQQHLRTILLGMATPVFPFPDVLVGQTGERLTDGVVTDPRTLEVLERFATGFATWVGRQSP